MSKMRIAFVFTGIIATMTAAIAEPIIRGAKARGTTAPVASEAAKESYYVPFVTGVDGRKHPIMEIPGGATVVSRKLMDDQQAITLGDALRNVSGVTVRGR